MKTCKTCGATKPLTEYPAAKGYAGGYKPHCKPCINVYKRERVSPEQRKGYSRKHMYGLTQSAYNDMVEAQGNLCLLCDCVLTTPHVDHCHSTGAVRGLLCKHCNTGLGHFKDDPVRLQRAVSYLIERRV